MQELDSQRVVINDWAARNGVVIDEWLAEVASGSEDERPVFRDLWRRVEEKKIGTIVVAELSRLSRRMRTLINFLYDCVDNDVHLISIREGWLSDAMKNPITRPVVVSMISTLYELERVMISERTKAGLQRARLSGKRLGRPPKLKPEHLLEAIKMYRQGVSMSEIARRLGVDRSTLYRSLKKLELL
jgi:DNA invertase Pin-like site-specific DNA recombinase